MSKEKRTGARRKRSARKQIHIPCYGYYMIVTDTEGTERCFFEGMHESLPAEIKNNLVVKVTETKTVNLVNKCLEYLNESGNYRIPWIIFDRDQVKNFDEIIKNAENHGINVGWSNPCFEIWMFAYFGNMPNINESWKCCEKFGELYQTKTGRKYTKSDKNIYKHLTDNGDERKAIEIAINKEKECKRKGLSKPSDMIPCSTVYKVVNEIRKKWNEF